MATIDNLTLEIKADANKAVTSLNNLSTAMQTLKASMPTKAKLESTAKGFNTLATEISKLSLSAKNLDKIKAISTIAKNLSKFNTINASKLKTTADNLDSLQGAMSHISYQAVEKIERLASAFSKLGEANKNMGSLKNVQKTANLSAQANPIATTPANSGTSSVSGSSGNSSAQGIGGAIFSLDKFWTKYSTISQMVKSNPIQLLANAENAEKMASLSKTLGMSVGAVTKLTTALGGAGIAFSVVSSAVGIFTNAIKKVIAPIQNFIRSLGRIAMYRALRGILKGISQGLKEGIQNLALYSKALDGLDTHNANEVLSRYASAFLYVKNAIATAVMPVLRALIPLVEQAMFRLVDFINIIAQVGSAFFGTNFTKAKYFWVDYADGLDNATGRAKALHHQLAQFDELNNLSAPSSGSGGSDKLADALDMFEEAKIDDKIKGIVDKIRGAFETVKEMFEPVKRIVDKAKELFEQSWEKVAPNLKRIWTTLKGIWNDTLKPFIKGFIEGFVDGFLATDTFKNLPDFLGLISEKVADLVDEWTKWTKFLTPDQWERLGKAIGFVTGWVLDLIVSVLTGQSTFSTFKEKVKVLTEYLSKTFAPEIAGTKAVIGYLIDKVSDAIGFFKELYDRTLNLHEPTSTLSTKIEELKNKFKDAYDKAKDFATKLFNMCTDILEVKKKAEALKSYWENHNIFENVMATAVVFIYELAQINTILDAIKKFGEIVIKITLNLTNGSVLDNLLNSLSKIGSDVAEKVSEIEKETTNPKAELPSTTPSTKTSNNNNKTVSPTNLKNTRNSTDNSTLIKKRRALGGFVPKGDLFIANEVAPEMVGRIGGNTAVANNNQITEAIAQATYTAMARALSENGQNVNIVVEGDGEKMFRVFQKKQREYIKDTGFAY